MELGERIKYAADKVGGLDVLAAKLETIKRRTLSDYVSGKSEPKISALVEIAETTGLDGSWLAFGETDYATSVSGSESRFSDHSAQARDTTLETMGGRAAQVIKSKPSSRQDLDPALTQSSRLAMIALPQYNVNAKAGSGEVPVDQESVSAIWFERPFLRQMGATPDQCFVIEARGESMSPSIPDGALLVVDSSQTTVQNGCIYIFNVGDVVVVKRAIWSFSEQLTLQSDNPSPSYPDEVFDKKRASELNVVGRVVFYGRKA